MARAREVAGENVVLTGNVDPLILYSKPETIERAVHECISQAGGGKHVLNLGHGVEKDTSEEAVVAFVNTAKSIRLR